MAKIIEDSVFSCVYLSCFLLSCGKCVAIIHIIAVHDNGGPDMIQTSKLR